MLRDKFHFYEHAVTNADMLARFCRAAHGGNPTILREDFSGTAALARAWLALDDAHRSIAIDLDKKVLSRACSEAKRSGLDRRLTTRKADAARARDKADVIAATNFPLGYFHERGALIAYLKRARVSLKPGGVLVADMYGGANAFTPGVTRRAMRDPDGTRFTYIWEQLDADARTGLVHNAIHFEVREGGKKRVLRDAFTYHWRLWSIPELADAFKEAGFTAAEAHDRLGDAMDGEGNLYVSAPDPDERLDQSWVVYMVGRR